MRSVRFAGCRGTGLKGRAGLLALSLLLLTLVPMWAAVIGEIRHERVLTEAVARKDAMNLATAFEAHVRSVIRLMDMILLDMRADLLDQRPLEQTLGKEQQAYGSVVTQMAVIDAQGRLVFSNLAKVEAPVDLSDREHFRVHRDHPQQDRLYISKPVLGRVSKQWTIQFTRPIHKDGQFAGVLVLSVPTGFFSDYYQQIDVGAHGMIALLGTDRSLRAIASGSPIPGRYGRFQVPESRPYFAAQSPPQGYYEGISAIDGEHRLGAYRRLKEDGVVVVVLLSPTDFMAAFEARKQLLLASAALISVLLLALAALLYVLARRHFLSTARLQDAHQVMSQLASTDMLTGVSNRRALLLDLAAEVDRAQRHGEPLSLVMLDIDHFKHVNDAYGHPIGDEVLKAFTATCMRMLRSHDLIGRLGGEEFALVLPHTDAEGARCVAEKIRLAIAGEPIVTSVGDIAITVSLGLTQLQADDQHIDALIARADRALYRAKRSGRNQVCSWVIEANGSGNDSIGVMQGVPC